MKDGRTGETCSRVLLYTCHHFWVRAVPWFDACTKDFLFWHCRRFHIDLRLGRFLAIQGSCSCAAVQKSSRPCHGRRLNRLDQDSRLSNLLWMATKGGTPHRMLTISLRHAIQTDTLTSLTPTPCGARFCAGFCCMLWALVRVLVSFVLFVSELSRSSVLSLTFYNFIKNLNFKY